MFQNFPHDFQADLRHRLDVDNVCHLVNTGTNEAGEAIEYNIRLYAGVTKSGKNINKLSRNLIRAGAYGLNWKTKEIHWIGLDIDSKPGCPITSPEVKDDIAKRLAALGYIEVRNSSSGTALHCYVDMATPISGVESEKDYLDYRRALISRIERDMVANGWGGGPLFDRAGTLLYMWKKDAPAEGYKLLYRAGVRFIDKLEPEKKSVRTGMTAPGWPTTEEDAIIRGWTGLQYKLLSWLANNDPSFTPDPAQGILCHCHTHRLLQAVKELGIPGYFSSNSPATDLGHHNAYITFSGPIIRVWRAGNGPSNETDAWMVVNDRSVAVLNAVLRTKLCTLTGLQALSKTDRARGGVTSAVLQKLNISVRPEWTNIEANIQVNTSKVKFIVKSKGPAPEHWHQGATQITYTLDIDDGLHGRKLAESGMGPALTGQADSKDVAIQYTRDDSGEVVLFFQNDKGEWLQSTNETLLRTYLGNRYNLSGPEVKRIMADKHANEVMIRVEMPCISFGPFEYEKRTYWNVPPTDYGFPKPEGKRLLSRISYIHPELQGLASRCPGWFALYTHIFANLEVPKDIADRYGIRSGADYGLLWAAYKIANPLNIVPILVLAGPAEAGKTFFSESFRHFFTNRGAYKITNALSSNYADWIGVVIAASDDLDQYDNNVITRLKNIGSGDRLEINPKFKRGTLIGGYMSLIMNMQTPTGYPMELDDRTTHVKIEPVNEQIYNPEFFLNNPPVTDVRIHARIPNIHMTLNEQAQYFFEYLCRVELPEPVRRYALPPAGKRSII
jgi:hypothetical protein